jgi:hypothetical protein
VKSATLRRVVLALCIPWVAALACGGRTGDDLFEPDGGAGSSTVGAGGRPAIGAGNQPTRASGGTVSKPARGSGGVAVAGSPGTGSSFGQGGAVLIGAGGLFGGAGAFTGAGGVALDCATGTCLCSDCLSTCLCKSGLSPTCIQQCGGVGGAVGAGGAAESGGVSGAGGSPAICFDPATNSKTSCATPPIMLPSCCTTAGDCGVELATGSSPPTNLPFVTGCQSLNQPGNYDVRCPDLSQLVGAASGGPAGCCRADGTCGIDFSTIGLGCLQSIRGGGPFSCSSGAVPDSGAAGAPPTDAGSD